MYLITINNYLQHPIVIATNPYIVQFNNYSKGSPQSPQLQQESLTILLAKKDSATYPIAKENHSSIEY